MNTCMDAPEALDLVMRIHHIKGSDLAAQSGVTEGMISRYRNKKRDLTASSLMDILKAMPTSARNLFISLTSDDIDSLPVSLLKEAATKYDTGEDNN
jgi:transcriptional regulator with XRE-family HTH domain